MSGTGYYISSGLDLTDIFLPLSSGTSIDYDTGFSTLVNSTSIDLRYVFASISSGSSIGYDTGYSVTGKGDLGAIFAKNTSYTTTGNPTITTQNGYTFIQFLSSGTGSITFIDPSAGLQISYLVVGGGGAGGSTYNYEEGTKIAQFYTGGGGAGGEVTQGTFLLSASTTLTTSIGAGAIASTTSVIDGTNSSITYSSTTYQSQGGEGGGLYNSTNPYTTPGGTGINSSGNGGNGGAWLININNSIFDEYPATSSPSSSYDSSYSNISINGYSLGYAVSGGGGAGSTDLDPPYDPLAPTGSGGSSGYVDTVSIPTTLIASENGTYGGGGGGASAYNDNISGTTALGANGGDGLVIVSFLSTL